MPAMVPSYSCGPFLTSDDEPTRIPAHRSREREGSYARSAAIRTTPGRPTPRVKAPSRQTLRVPSTTHSRPCTRASVHLRARSCIERHRLNHCVLFRRSPPQMKTRTILWTVINASNAVVTCSIEEQSSGDIKLSVELESNELISEIHYTPAEALTRARELR